MAQSNSNELYHLAKAYFRLFIVAFYGKDHTNKVIVSEARKEWGLQSQTKDYVIGTVNSDLHRLINGSCLV